MQKEKWFFINISSVEVSDGFPNFYLQNLPQDCHYYKFTAPPNRREFERVLYDWAGVILLQHGVPSYNLVIIISKPLGFILPNVEKDEQSVTPFMYYLDQCIEKFRTFVECKPNYKIIFELDREIGVHAENAADAHHSSAYYLDNQPKSTKYYQIGESWAKDLKNNLEEGVVKADDTNLRYLSRVKNIKYYRISLYQQQAVYLHYVFSFLQLFITHEDEIKKNIFTNNTIKGIEFEGNEVPSYIQSFSKQVDITLDEISKKLVQNIEKGVLFVVVKKEQEIQEQLKKISDQLKKFSCSKEGLSCETANAKVTAWEEEFENFTKNIPQVSYDFNVFLNSVNNIIDKEKKEESGNLKFWRREQKKLEEEQKLLTQKIKTSIFDENQFIEKWEESLFKIFIEIREDVKRCPNQVFMIITLVVSLIFYAISFYAIFNAGLSSGYVKFFSAITVLYLIMSLYLFKKYRNESINKIREKVDQVKKINEQQVEKFISLMRTKTENQFYIYSLGLINQNNQICEERINRYQNIENKIKDFKEQTSSIRSISSNQSSKHDFNFKAIEEEKLVSIERFFKVFDEEFSITNRSNSISKTISISKNNNNLNEGLRKIENMNNALKSINIHTT